LEVVESSPAQEVEETSQVEVESSLGRAVEEF
jgi:hypothetical protein